MGARAVFPPWGRTMKRTGSGWRSDIAAPVATGGLAVLFMALAVTAFARESGWKLTKQDENPRIFAITEPSASNLNVKVIALTCEEVDGRKSLQFQIYPTNLEPILPVGSSRDQMKDEPRAEIVVDGQIYPTLLAFGGDYGVLMDREEGGLPVLSRPLLEAIEHGHTMIVRFDLLREPVGRPGEFDGELRIDLQSGEGSAAIAAVRRACAF